MCAVMKFAGCTANANRWVALAEHSNQRKIKMDQFMMLCGNPLLAILICVSLPIGIVTFLDILSGRPPKEWAINMLFDLFCEK